MVKGTKDDPWRLKTPPGTSDIVLWRDADANPPALICVAGGTSSAITSVRPRISQPC